MVWPSAMATPDPFTCEASYAALIFRPWFYCAPQSLLPPCLHTIIPVPDYADGYARIHQYYIVAVGHPGDVVDKDGTQHLTTNVTGWPLMKLASLDIDRVFVHWFVTPIPI